MRSWRRTNVPLAGLRTLHLLFSVNSETQTTVQYVAGCHSKCPSIPSITLDHSILGLILKCRCEKSTWSLRITSARHGLPRTVDHEETKSNLPNDSMYMEQNSYVPCVGSHCPVHWHGTYNWQRWDLHRREYTKALAYIGNVWIGIECLGQFYFSWSMPVRHLDCFPAPL